MNIKLIAEVRQLDQEPRQKYVLWFLARTALRPSLWQPFLHSAALDVGNRRQSAQLSIA